METYPPARESLLSRGAWQAFVSLQNNKLFRRVFATSRALPAEQLSVKRNVIKMTDLFSINAIQTHFSQFTLKKKGKGQRFTKGRGSRGGGRMLMHPDPRAYCCGMGK